MLFGNETLLLHNACVKGIYFGLCGMISRLNDKEQIISHISMFQYLTELRRLQGD